MLNPNAAVRCTAISNLLNEIETKRYSLPYLMGNPDLGATVTDFMTTLQAITTSLKAFLMYLMRFLQNSFEAFLSVNCWL